MNISSVRSFIGYVCHILEGATEEPKKIDKNQRRVLTAVSLLEGFAAGVEAGNIPEVPEERRGRIYEVGRNNNLSFVRFNGSKDDTYQIDTVLADALAGRTLLNGETIKFFCEVMNRTVWDGDVGGPPLPVARCSSGSALDNLPQRGL